jgi:pimeloyl-ACP methyl ester carboxylesterase
VDNPSQPAGDYDVYLKVAPGPDYAGFDACFATDVPTLEANMLAATQGPIALGAFTAPFSGTPAWTSIPSWAVIGTDDQVVPPADLTFLAQRAHSHITYVKAGHLSMIAQPCAVANVIKQAVWSTS